MKALYALMIAAALASFMSAPAALAVLAAPATPTPVPPEATEVPPPPAAFDIGADGVVSVDGYTFTDLSEYVRSDYFRTAGKRCGTRLRGPAEAAQAAALADCDLTRTVIRPAYWPGGSIMFTIPVVFHVISRSDGTGDIANQRLYDQLLVMNEDYGALASTLGEKGFNVQIRFVLAAITRTTNDNWFADVNEMAYKQALGWDQSRYLNIYLNSAGGYLGYAYFPQEDAGNVVDGVVLLYESVGGRDNGYDVYDQGRTAVHEIGHYLGLLHPFEGYGCFTGYQAGDLIVDTNPENDEHYGCTQTYSCGLPDNIHNYMDYTDDSCMEEFTPEQANRMVCSLLNYRPLLARSMMYMPLVWYQYTEP